MDYFGHNYYQAQHTPACIIRSEMEGNNDVEYNRVVWMDYVEATRKAQNINYWWQVIASDPAMDGT